MKNNKKHRMRNIKNRNKQLVRNTQRNSLHPKSGISQEKSQTSSWKLEKYFRFFLCYLLTHAFAFLYILANNLMKFRRWYCSEQPKMTPFKKLTRIAPKKELVNIIKCYYYYFITYVVFLLYIFMQYILRIKLRICPEQRRKIICICVEY
ncbi:unnamed protein product [Nezara viridula]|uniref:Uncharacterized protein n=1 Tax=Nezara viridula TaxID=85310 RepID=A0A9P0EBH6_NEZVI|nr:unnamed protein product [Nezara viridula]